MTTATAPDKKPTASDGKPTPIRVARLLIVHNNVAGIRLALFDDKMHHTLTSGEHGDHRLEIEYRPWMRHHRIARFNKVPLDDNKHTWKPAGVCYVPEQFATWTPADE